MFSDSPGVLGLFFISIKSTDLENYSFLLRKAIICPRQAHGLSKSMITVISGWFSMALGFPDGQNPARTGPEPVL